MPGAQRGTNNTSLQLHGLTAQVATTTHARRPPASPSGPGNRRATRPNPPFTGPAGRLAGAACPQADPDGALGLFGRGGPKPDWTLVPCRRHCRGRTGQDQKPVCPPPDRPAVARLAGRNSEGASRAKKNSPSVYTCDYALLMRFWGHFYGWRLGGEFM